MKVADKGAAALAKELEAQLAALEDSHRVMAGAVASLVAGSGASASVLDLFAAPGAPRSACGGAQESSSVRPRRRQGEGLPVHALLAGLLEGAGGDAGSFADVFDYEGRTAEERLRETLRSERLIDFYEDSMGDLHDALDTLDFHRGEDLWHERYRGDARREMDAAELRERGDAARADAEHAARRADLEAAERRHADALARSAADADRMAADLEAARRRELDDYYARMRR
jgi:hypothetical protein